MFLCFCFLSEVFCFCFFSLLHPPLNLRKQLAARQIPVSSLLFLSILNPIHTGSWDPPVCAPLVKEAAACAPTAQRLAFLFSYFSDASPGPPARDTPSRPAQLPRLAPAVWGGNGGNSALFSGSPPHRAFICLRFPLTIHPASVIPAPSPSLVLFIKQTEALGDLRWLWLSFALGREGSRCARVR